MTSTASKVMAAQHNLGSLTSRRGSRKAKRTSAIQIKLKLKLSLESSRRSMSSLDQAGKGKAGHAPRVHVIAQPACLSRLSPSLRFGPASDKFKSLGVCCADALTSASPARWVSSDRRQGG